MFLYKKLKSSKEQLDNASLEYARTKQAFKKLNEEITAVSAQLTDYAEKIEALSKVPTKKIFGEVSPLEEYKSEQLRLQQKQAALELAKSASEEQLSSLMSEAKVTRHDVYGEHGNSELSSSRPNSSSSIKG